MNIFYYKERRDQYPKLRGDPLSANMLGYIIENIFKKLDYEKFNYPKLADDLFNINNQKITIKNGCEFKENVWTGSKLRT